MTFPDAHRHGLPLPGSRALVSCSLGREACPEVGSWCAGLHPWHLDESTLEERLRDLEAALAGPGVQALGECGLDRACGVAWELQGRAFEAQRTLARERSLPVVLHAVKAFPEILRAHRSAATPWIVHGFRGGPELALDLWRHGLRLSFGGALLREPRLQAAFRTLPEEALLLESDEEDLDLPGLYGLAARLRGLEAAELGALVDANLAACGIRLSGAPSGD